MTTRKGVAQVIRVFLVPLGLVLAVHAWSDDQPFFAVAWLVLAVGQGVLFFASAREDRT
jgi:hypothetical protein